MLGRLCGAAGRRGYTSVGGVRSLEAGLITASQLLNTTNCRVAPPPVGAVVGPCCSRVLAPSHHSYSGPKIQGREARQPPDWWGQGKVITLSLLKAGNMNAQGPSTHWKPGMMNGWGPSRLRATRMNG